METRETHEQETYTAIFQNRRVNDLIIENSRMLIGAQNPESLNDHALYILLGKMAKITEDFHKEANIPYELAVRITAKIEVTMLESEHNIAFVINYPGMFNYKDRIVLNKDHAVVNDEGVTFPYFTRTQEEV